MIFQFGTGFDFAVIFRDYFIKMLIGFIDFFYTVMYKRYEIGCIFTATITPGQTVCAEAVPMPSVADPRVDFRLSIEFSITAESRGREKYYIGNILYAVSLR
jgi:hypothetical protein